jgi:acyl-CoA reductase-like NAD-dependent aldehyde dehydrogenase
MTRLKLMIAAAMKAKRTWDRIPPEQRRRALESAKTTVRTHGPIVARKAADTARTQAPIIARRIGQAIEKARQAMQEPPPSAKQPRQEPKPPPAE